MIPWHRLHAMVLVAAIFALGSSAHPARAVSTRQDVRRLVDGVSVGVIRFDDVRSDLRSTSRPITSRSLTRSGCTSTYPSDLRSRRTPARSRCPRRRSRSRRPTDESIPIGGNSLFQASPSSSAVVIPGPAASRPQSAPRSPRPARSTGAPAPCPTCRRASPAPEFATTSSTRSPASPCAPSLRIDALANPAIGCRTCPSSTPRRSRRSLAPAPRACRTPPCSWRRGSPASTPNPSPTSRS